MVDGPGNEFDSLLPRHLAHVVQVSVHSHHPVLRPVDWFQDDIGKITGYR